MSPGSGTSLIPLLRKQALAGDAGSVTDGQLVEWFLSQKEETAFRALLHRHGPMVMGVCRRVLHDTHDAEDAFQATFLVLARKAASIVPPEMVANWLYGVAYRTAQKARVGRARANAAKRRMHDKVTAMAKQVPTEDEIWHDLQPVLDQELQRLQDKYRVAIVLCDLQGKSRKEAAQKLGWPEGTLSGRLARGRKLLAKRLTQRGVTLSVASLTAVLTKDAVSAAVPPILESIVTRAALLFAGGSALSSAVVSAKVSSLTHGVLKAMLMSKLKVPTLVFLAVLLLSSGATLFGNHVPTADKEPATPTTSQTPVNEITKRTAHDAELHVIGLYGPKGLTENNKRVDVEVQPTPKPIVLVLTSYYTVDWNLKLAPGTRLSRVILGGGNEQTIEGVPSGVPVDYYFPKTWKNRSVLWFYAYDPKSRNYQEMVRRLNEMTTLPVASFQGNYEGASFTVDGHRGSNYAQKELNKPPISLPDPSPQQILAAVADAELHVVAVSKPRAPCEPVDVEVRKTTKPVVLALAGLPYASGSETWRLKIADGARLRLVVLGGWASDIEGLPAGVPVIDQRRFRSEFHAVQEVPGYLLSDHQANTFTYRKMIDQLNSLTGLRVKSFQGKAIGDAFEIDDVKGREFEQKAIASRPPTLNPQELLAAARECELHIVGVHGSREIEPVRVEVRETAKPVVLVLTSRTSVLWRLELADKGRIRAVILGGQSEQDIDGVPPGIPVIQRTCYPDDASGRENGYFFAGVVDSVGYREMTRKLNTITGLPVASFQGAAFGTTFTVDGVRGNQFAETQIKPSPVRPSLTPEELRAAASDCELHYVNTTAPKGAFSSGSESVTVEVTAAAKPNVIVLASGLPVIWKFKLANKVKVKAIIVGGSHKPEIDGLPADVPVVDCATFSTVFPAAQAKWTKPQLDSTCEWGSIDHLHTMQKLNALTGLPVATCQGEPLGFEFVIDGTRGRNFGQKEIESPRRSYRSLNAAELLEAAADAEMHVVGTYWAAKGTAGTPVAGAAGGVVEVEVRPTDKPIVLVLTSWFSVVWKPKLADKARVKAIIIGGGFEQEIVDVPKDVPVIVLPVNQDNFPTHQYNCPEFRNLTRTLKTMTALPVATFQGNDIGVSFLVDGVRGRDFAKKPDAPPKSEQVQDPAADVADIASQDLKAAEDANKRYFLIGTKKDANAPKEGYGLLIIMPGGDGSADFNPFVKRIYKNALPENYIVAQPVAVKWTANQQIVWPTKTNPVDKMKFTTEEFVDAVIDDVAKKHKVDRTRVFTLSWSSSGPAAYAASLRSPNKVTGSFIAMSVFNPRFLPSLDNAKGHPYYLYHSEQDRVCPCRMAEQAKTNLTDKGAKVHLEKYEGGHGWRGNLYDDIRTGVEWLEKNGDKASKPQGE